ncbi:hypothetical protein CDD81_1823 [Ophiocordyceps australis]|uniref:Grh/CP2 DB domain-containing protein n=1 Tax=Ophiocordyceps australis TaxID=1399860 RepID=A0A2C5XF54_9HYPO|nr:hypothetical protein CDD81_1823 [Ophiocordyceps australis]
MFRQRTSSQKPGDDLLANFRQQFPQVVAVSGEMSGSATMSAPARQDSLPQADSEPFRDHDPTPRAAPDGWRFTPALLDSNSFAFGPFANYYTATPGATSAMLPSQGPMATGLGTPLSMAASAEAVHPGAAVLEMAGFQSLQPHGLHGFNPFLQASYASHFAPSPFVHHDTGYETMDHDASPIDSAATLHSQKMAAPAMGHALPAAADKFRFHSTLNAPTAMIKHADEIPVTYLNKGQAYSLSIADTSLQPAAKYRTFVRVSFEDDEQRQKPGVCWSLWKEGRGTNEAHQRGGKLQAVEFVEAGQVVEGDDKRTRVELESSSFDGFSLVWTPGSNGAPEVNIAVRFNFLSTDFSHSKGVKGIPVRFCAKTTVLPPADGPTEICFCKVKLFRDHGAERKLTNDVAHVKKSIDKMKQQLAQIESGVKDMGKRKRHSVVAKSLDVQRAGKMPKHKRTWSMSSASSAGGGGTRTSMEEELHIKLQTLQDMFTSTRPVSVLYLRGEELDDADVHPVSLPGEASPTMKPDGLRDGPSWQTRSAPSSATGSMASPSPSSLSLVSQASAMGSAPHSAARKHNRDSMADGDGSKQALRVARTDDDGALSGWIEALGVDASYRPPPDRSEKPVACFYLVDQAKAESGKKVYHRAVYLMKRTVEELNGRIARKWGLEASRIQRTIRIMRNIGIETEVDDDVVREIKEGQDMGLSIEEVDMSSPLRHTTGKREWDMMADESGHHGNKLKAAGTTGLILRLTF